MRQVRSEVDCRSAGNRGRLSTVHSGAVIGVTVRRAPPVLFGTVVIVRKLHPEGMRVLRFIGDAVGVLLVVLVVPVAILAVGVPVALGRQTCVIDVRAAVIFLLVSTKRSCSERTMNASLPIADSPPYEEPTPVTVLAASRMPVTLESVPFDQGRWDAWVTKGRLADTAFTEKVRMLAMLGVTIGIGVGTVWIILG